MANGNGGVLGIVFTGGRIVAALPTLFPFLVLAVLLILPFDIYEAILNVGIVGVLEFLVRGLLSLLVQLVNGIIIVIAFIVDGLLVGLLNLGIGLANAVIALINALILGVVNTANSFIIGLNAVLDSIPGIGPNTIGTIAPPGLLGLLDPVVSFLDLSTLQIDDAFVDLIEFPRVKLPDGSFFTLVLDNLI